EAAKVLQHDRIVVERVRRAEEAAAMREPAFGHRLDHHVDVAAVVEVPVADDDRVQLCQVDFALGVLHDGARARVECDARLAILYVEATGGGQLLGDHEPSAGGAHESQLHVSATSLRSASVLPPKYSSYSSSTRSSVSISSTGLSSRMRTMRGKRSAKPLRCRPECWMESNATSSTTSGRTIRTWPMSSTVIARKRTVKVAISASVSPGYAR